MGGGQGREKAVVTFPVPGVPGATAVATLTNYLPDSVVVTNGADKTEFIYGKWADWNNPLFKIDALYAGTWSSARTARSCAA